MLSWCLCLAAAAVVLALVRGWWAGAAGNVWSVQVVLALGEMVLSGTLGYLMLKPAIKMISFGGAAAPVQLVPTLAVIAAMFWMLYIGEYVADRGKELGDWLGNLFGQ